MYPSLWFWAPQFHFPWGGNVAQQIEPNTNWLFGAIAPNTGNGKVEQRVFEEVASYGKQLGILTEVVLGLSEHNQPLSANARRSLSQLEELRGRIAAIKDEEVASFAVVVEDWLTKLRVSNSEQFAQIQQQLTAALADTTG
jgi:hypothetical protein